MMVRQKRKSKAPSPDCKQHLENAALGSHIRKTFEKAQQEEAFKEVIKAMASNGGKVDYEAIYKLVQSYHTNGFKAVMRQNFYCRLSKQKNSKNSALLGAIVVTTSSETQGVISDLTTDQSFPNSNCKMCYLI
jgi:hypothetical protein